MKKTLMTLLIATMGMFTTSCGISDYITDEDLESWRSMNESMRGVNEAIIGAWFEGMSRKPSEVPRNPKGRVVPSGSDSDRSDCVWNEPWETSVWDSESREMVRRTMPGGWQCGAQ